MNHGLYTESGHSVFNPQSRDYPGHDTDTGIPARRSDKAWTPLDNDPDKRWIWDGSMWIWDNPDHY